MNPNELIVRKLDPPLCQVVGTRLQTNWAALLKDGTVFPDKLQQRAAGLASITGALASLPEDEMSMRVVDRYTDRCVASLSSFLGAVEGLWVEHPSLPISLEAAERAKNAERLRGLCFPNGTSFLTASYDVQWVELERVQRSLQGEEGSKLVQALGLSQEAARVSQWIQRYGERLGVTAVHIGARGAHAQKLAEAWHEAYAALLVQVFAAFDEPANPAHEALRESFIAPYREALEKLRAYERSASPRAERVA
jgi:hypothetical protein